MNLTKQQVWDGRFLRLAAMVSEWSKDPSTKCGAVIVRGNRVLGMGFNGFPPAIPDDPELLTDRASKYARVIHAEVNAVLDAYRKGQDLTGATLYTYPPGLAPTCDRCAAHVIATGISRVVHVYEDSDFARRWNPETSLQLYKEAGVTVDAIPSPDPWKVISDRHKD